MPKQGKAKAVNAVKANAVKGKAVKAKAVKANASKNSGKAIGILRNQTKYYRGICLFRVMNRIHRIHRKCSEQ